MKKSFDLRVFLAKNQEEENKNWKNYNSWIYQDDINILKGKTWIEKSYTDVIYHRFYKGNYYRMVYDCIVKDTRLEINDNLVRTKEGNQKFYYDIEGNVVEVKNERD